MRSRYLTVSLCLGLGGTAVGQAPSPSAASVDALRAEVAGDVQEQARASLAEYFARMQLMMPELVTTKVEAMVDTSLDGLELKRIKVNVTMTTSHPPQVIRQARLQVQRDLESMGQAVDLNIVANAPLGPVPKSWQEKGRAGLTLAALSLGALSLMALSGLMLVRGWRRGRQRPKSFTPETLPKSGPRVGFDDLPQVGISPAMAGGYEGSPINVLDLAPPPPLPKFVEEPSAALVRELAEMPLERALSRLAAMTEEHRARVMERLHLQPSLRKRLEKELG